MRPVQLPSKAQRLNAVVNVIPTTFPAHQGLVLDKQKAVYRVQVITARRVNSTRRANRASSRFRDRKLGRRGMAAISRPRGRTNFAIFQQDKGLLISQRPGLLFGTLRGRINTALTSRLRDYPNYSTVWDLVQVRNR